VHIIRNTAGKRAKVKLGVLEFDSGWCPAVEIKERGRGKRGDRVQLVIAGEERPGGGVG